MARSSRNFAARIQQFTLRILACPLFLRTPCTYAVDAGMSIQCVTFSAETLAAAAALEPSLESLLRSHIVRENVLAACRCQDFLTRSAFINLDRGPRVRQLLSGVSRASARWVAFSDLQIHKYWCAQQNSGELQQSPYGGVECVNRLFWAQRLNADEVSEAVEDNEGCVLSFQRR